MPFANGSAKTLSQRMPGGPHKGWVCQSVEDLEERDATREMCEVGCVLPRPILGEASVNAEAESEE